MSKTTEKVPASEVREGDFIPGLDNAYVIEATTEECSTFGSSDRYSMALGEFVVITYNDAQGGEGYLLLTEDTLVEVAR